MSEHIQECPSSNTCDCNMGPVHKDSCPQRKKCICHELRAYGERLIAEEDRMIPIIRRNEYQRGLDAARDAVAAAQAEAGDINFCKDCADWSVAAIDAL